VLALPGVLDRRRLLKEAPTERPLVSIVVPVFNGARYLRQSLDSILAQSYGRIEVLVMDDASDDETPAIIASYGDAVQVRRQTRNRGIYANANDGIATARGELVAVYHADDVYHPTIVEREVEFLTRYPEAGAVFCADVFVDAEGREYARLQLPPEVRGNGPLAFPTVLNALLEHKNSFLVCPTAMVRASVYARLGSYDQERFRNTSDVDMWLRIARHYPIGVLEEHLLDYRHFHGSSAQRYHHLRTAPERFFEIMDVHLRNGAAEVATEKALAAYETHRAVDRTKGVISHYIKGELADARSALAAMDVQAIRRPLTRRRAQTLAMIALLHVLSRLPRIPFLADLFYRKWYVKAPPRPSC
jgi:GT2 family glycosyltransferase